MVAEVSLDLCDLTRKCTVGNDQICQLLYRGRYTSIVTNSKHIGNILRRISTKAATESDANQVRYVTLTSAAAYQRQ